ncbi:MAG: hypothetical protein ACJ790_12260 [Myxococcaceae bacterium]
MARLHLLELEDQPWFPRAVRDGATDYLAFVGNLLEAPYQAFLPRLAEAMRKIGDSRLVDLASGGSGPVQVLVRLLRARELNVTATLTDLYPNLPKFADVAQNSGGTIDFVSESVDATNVPEDLLGFRTVCNAFHHFQPDLALKIIEDAVHKRQGIAILEFVERSPFSMAAIPLAAVQSALVAPVIKPFRPSRLFFSWAVPLIPFTVLWDGLVSCLRVYSVGELHALVGRIQDARYIWDIRRDAFGPLGSTTLIGIPAERVR